SERNAVRRVEGCGFRQDLGEHHDRNGHNHGGIDHTHFAEPGEEHTCRERGRGDVDCVVAEKERTDHSFASTEQMIDQHRAPIPLLFEPVHAGRRGSGQRGLTSREEGGEEDTNENRHQGEPIVGSHRSAIFSARKARISAASTSDAMKLAPIPRARMKVSLPRLTFLSWAMRSIRRSASGTPPGTEDTWIGRPTAARWRSTRSASAGDSSPRLAENAKASVIPSAIASPCNRRSEKPAAASSAWPKVWPRLSSARSPTSRSSRPTIAAFMRQLTAMACSRAEPPA